MVATSTKLHGVIVLDGLSPSQVYNTQVLSAFSENTTHGGIICFQISQQLVTLLFVAVSDNRGSLLFITSHRMVQISIISTRLFITISQ